MAKKDIVKVGLVGHGARGEGILRILGRMDDVEIVAVCDMEDEALKKAEETVVERKGYKPLLIKDYKKMLELEEIDAVVDTAFWDDHVDFAIQAMEAGKDVAIEVGGAYSIRECWKLVEAQERTGRRCMMLENCCYARKELALLHMVRNGKFGTVVNCTGGYSHDLRKGFVDRYEKSSIRITNYMHRNCENYPTHALGPISKILNVNRGNRMVSLTSTSSKAAGMEAYAKANLNEDHPLYNKRYLQGDIVTTVIQCAGGETITLTLDTTLPRAYSRHFGVCGTKGMYSEDGHIMFLEGVHDEYHENARALFGNADEILDQNDHPIWQGYEAETGIGHGNMDRFVMQAFVDSIKDDIKTPIDVYDCASWMCISVLSEESILKGGAPVAIPDFTNGRWIKRKFEQENKWSI